jgi:protein BCP1
VLHAQGEPYHFSHLLFLSRVFKSSLSALDDDPNAALEAAIVAEAEAKAKVPPKKKKQRKVGGAEQDEEKLWMYHVEDEFIQKVRHRFDCAGVALRRRASTLFALASSERVAH